MTKIVLLRPIDFEEKEVVGSLGLEEGVGGGVGHVVSHRSGHGHWDRVGVRSGHGDIDGHLLDVDLCGQLDGDLGGDLGVGADGGQHLLLGVQLLEGRGVSGRHRSGQVQGQGGRGGNGHRSSSVGHRSGSSNLDGVDGRSSSIGHRSVSISNRSSYGDGSFLLSFDSHDRSGHRSGQGRFQDLRSVSDNNRSRGVVDPGLHRSEGVDGRSVVSDGSSHCVSHRSDSVNQRSDGVVDGDGLVRLTVLVGIDALVRQVLQQVRRVDVGRSRPSNCRHHRQDDLQRIRQQLIGPIEQISFTKNFIVDCGEHKLLLHTESLIRVSSNL